MKTSKQDIHDLLAAIANDVEEIKAQLSGATSASVAADAGAAGKDNAISNEVTTGRPSATDFAVGNSAAIDYAIAKGNSAVTTHPGQTIADVKQLLEQIADVCGKLPDRIKSYCAQLLLRIPQDLREELTRDNDARKRKGQPTVEDKIDNSLTMLIFIYDRLNQLEDALQSDTSKSEQSGRIAAHGKSIRGKSANGNFAKLGFIARLKSAWSGVRRFCTKRPNRWYRNPYILCAISICLLYFALSIFSWKQWHYYRAENTRLHLTADKYRVDSIILRNLYPQAAITLSAYEHIIEYEGTEAAIEKFQGNINAIKNSSK